MGDVLNVWRQGAFQVNYEFLKLDISNCSLVLALTRLLQADWVTQRSRCRISALSLLHCLVPRRERSSGGQSGETVARQQTAGLDFWKTWVCCAKTMGTIYTILRNVLRNVLLRAVFLQIILIK